MSDSGPQIPNHQDWLKGVLAYAGGFLRSFHCAWMNADTDNREILSSALRSLMQKYPKYTEMGAALAKTREETA